VGSCYQLDDDVEQFDKGEELEDACDDSLPFAASDLAENCNYY